MNNPQIYMISSPSFDENALNKFLDEHGMKWLPTESASSAEHVVEVSGRVCYMSFSDDPDKIRYPNKSYIENLVAKGHESVLEHANWSFIIDCVSRSFTHQLVRHRVGFSYSQLSQQYYDQSSANFIRPAGLSGAAGDAWKIATDNALEAYKNIVTLINADQTTDFEEKRKMRSAARSLLPNSTSTAIAVTANARAIRHFIKIRGAIIGDVEMRLVSAELLKLVKSDSPSLFGDFTTSIHSDGWPITLMDNGEELG